MTLNFSLSPKNHQAFIVYNSLHSPNLKKKIRESGLTAAGLLAMLCVAAWHSWWSGLGTVAVVAALAYLTGRASFVSDLPNQAKKSLEESPEAELTEPMEVSLTPEGLVQNRPSGTLYINYAQIKKLAVNNEAIYVYYRALEAVIIPLSAFAGRSGRDDFMDIICRGNPALQKPVIPAFTEVKEARPTSYLLPILVMVVCFFVGGVPFSEPLRTCPNGPGNQASFGARQTESLETLGLTLVTDENSLALAARNSGGNLKAYTIEGREQIIVDLWQDQPGREISPAQLAAFSRMKNSYAAIRPEILNIMLADYQKMRGDIKNEGLTGKMFVHLFPDLKTTAELDAQLSMPQWYLHDKTDESGQAYVTMVFETEWNPEDGLGVLILGDKVLAAGVTAGAEIWPH